MKRQSRLWIALTLVFLASFGWLGMLGRDIMRAAPPVPESVISASGEVLYTGAEIGRGRQAWQSTGGQQLGSIWGHGAYLAPDWSADWLHREAVALLDLWARRAGAAGYAALDTETQGALRARLVAELRTNTHDPATGAIKVSADRAAVIREVAAHYAGLFGNEPRLAKLREAYAIADNAMPSAENRQAMTGFFFWTAWATATDRPGEPGLSYTSNWPHEPLVNNVPTTPSVVWSVVSVILLVAGIGALVWHHAAAGAHEEAPSLPGTDPLLGMRLTPSQKATGKYFLTVIGLFLAQVGLGALTAHYQVEGHEFFGIPLSQLLPYAVTRTWHTQLAVFWIATAWLATGLYIAPAISGYEPRFQKLGVDALWAALVLVVVGSMFGEWLGVQQKLGLDANFYFGHQGYEYVDLGRFWQILLFVGLMLWLVLMGRALMPALRDRAEAARPLLIILFLSTVAIGLFYAAGFMWGKHTHISLVEYWRWWVVHLWVEGFFEVFATCVISLLFTRLGLVRVGTANNAALFSTIVFLGGGILGTLHHLYFSGTPSSVIAVGAVFSALEVVPLSLVGFEAYENWRHSREKGWVAAYRWPILFFVAVSFWNLVGAGFFGFMINPPISLYYIQGLNTTATHGHAALFGVYGMLGIGLMLFCLRGLAPRHAWQDGYLKAAFWALNGGLSMMILFSLLPQGALQAWASVSHGLWYARSAEFMHQPLMHLVVWMRVPGDIVFSAGPVLLGIFAWKLVRAVRASARQRGAGPLPAPVPAQPAE
ncbi:nitric-oxide reductase large subunit [Muricoccus pecuniae]|uniref:Nitric oxide reductase subunit B n=1 Tax=Muricoccus pecuniae TaxID=693023 RepID=A0A840Y0M6_9PROT|nr:nitric-oxide reductase large subunit [Roseomonas pecuniae]MBB5692369.1 nitric oxide reductase subunit B [Roseomonas pecuniae]